MSRCPKAKNCRLYQNKLFPYLNSEDLFKKFYCDTEEFVKCKRYQCFESFGECPDYVMPNSDYSLSYVERKILEEKEFLKNINNQLTGN